MCGRFTRRYTWQELVALYRLTLGTSNLQPRYNICPTTTIDAVIEHDSIRELVPMRWGLIPNWWSKPLEEMRLATFMHGPRRSIKSRCFARRSNVTAASSLHPAITKWQATPTGKQPYYFTSTDGPILSISGIWDEWKDPDTGKPLRSCTMIITNPNKVAAKIHDRMPVLLSPDQFEPWLSGTAGTEILKPAADSMIVMRPVSRRVNSSRADANDATLIEAVAA
jgi:putative SOS response-associated peptidase YedK